jgi:hypothetical protein
LSQILWLARQDDIAGCLIAANADFTAFKAIGDWQADSLTLAIFE